MLGMFGGFWVGGVSTFSLLSIIAAVSNFDMETSNSTSAELLTFSLLGLCYAAVLGAMQWQLLQRLQLIPMWKLWIVPSSLGGLLAGLSVIAIPELWKFFEVPGPSEGFAYGVLWGASEGFVSGVFLSAPQLYYFRPVLRKTPLWVLANIFAWSIVFILLAIGPDDEGWSVLLTLPAAFFVSVITGLALILLLWLNRDALADNNPEKEQT
ncbi:MAG: hypothetical protein HZB44_02840 [Actinobacteria bacterium]|nr:hypothetical protein [Actinomycetota bacterium]